MALDITKFESISDVVQSCSKIHGSIDIVINNSGISYRGKVVDTSLQVDQSLMDVNYFGHIAIVKSRFNTCMCLGDKLTDLYFYYWAKIV